MQLMLDPSAAMQKAYFDLLNGSVSTPVYDAVPANAPSSYVVIGEDTLTENGVKDAILLEVTQTIICVAKLPKEGHGRKTVRQLANEVTRLVNNKNGSLLAPAGFAVITTVAEFATTFEEPGEVLVIYRRPIRFRHLLEQTAVS